MSKKRRQRRQVRVLLLTAKDSNYIPAVLSAARASLAPGNLVPGRMVIVDVEHDNGCGIFRGGECNCKPTIGKGIY